MSKIKKEIEDKLSLLLNTKWDCFGRAGNLLWSGFGESVTITDMKGNLRTVSEYSLHISCAWRLILEDKILVAYGDYYIPREGLTDDNFNWELFGENRFDEKAILISQDINRNSIHVIDIKADNLGGFKLYFDNKYVLEVFPNNSLGEEYWRFISNNPQSEHFVVFG